jgi:SAM-dependent methyltransferase
MAELKSFDRVAEIYDATRGLPPAAADQIADAIAGAVRAVAAAPRLVEIGIGTGRMAVPLAERGVRVAGTDIAPKMVALLREKRRDIDVVFAEAERPPFREGVFDAALFVHILHLVRDQRATVLTAARLLRAGGVLILGYEDYDGVRQQADDIMERIGAEFIPGLRPGRERQQENLEAFRGACAEAGFGQCEQVVAARWPETITGQAILDSNTRRQCSGSWTVPDEAMQAMVRRAEPQMAALFGGLDNPRSFNRTFELLVSRPD